MSAQQLRAAQLEKDLGRSPNRSVTKSDLDLIYLQAQLLHGSNGVINSTALTSRWCLLHYDSKEEKMRCFTRAMQIEGMIKIITENLRTLKVAMLILPCCWLPATPLKNLQSLV